MIKLFVGCAPNGEDAESQMVLEYSARKHTSVPIDIVWMKISNDPKSFWHGWNSIDWSTPFSGFRWGIPAYCKYKGQAIYMDSDMIIQRDLLDLWKQPLDPGTIALAKGGWRFCVTKFDNEAAKKHLMAIDMLKANRMSHKMTCEFMQMNEKFLVTTFDPQWNNYDGENNSLDQVKILHYTDMSTQPHIKYALPRLAKAGIKHWYDGPIRTHRRKDVEELFDEYYNEAISNGYSVEQYEPSEVISYSKLSQSNYSAHNGFDVTKGE